jgi:hypothetical protein
MTAADATARAALRRDDPYTSRQPMTTEAENERASSPRGSNTGGRCYAGIGSRRTPAATLAIAEQIARALAARGWRLRSGHAPGADQAFEQGAAGDADIFLPWPAFERATPVLGRAFSQPAPAAFDLAREHHPNWPALRRGGRALHARNCHQILGWTLQDPASFVICWTPDGSLDGQGRDTGGTGQALRLCVAHDVPVFNLARPDHLARLTTGLDLHAGTRDASPLNFGTDIA